MTLLKEDLYMSYNDKTSSKVKELISDVKRLEKPKINAIWLEEAGCSGNIISLLDASSPDVIYFLNNMVNLTYNNSIMAKEGEKAFDSFLKTLSTDFILFVEGAISTRENGRYCTIAAHEGREITGLEAVKMAGEKAKYVIAVGTCASFGGISAASPNETYDISVSQALQREVINTPGCPCNPEWVIGTTASIILNGRPELDSLNRPLLFYGTKIHDTCPRRIYFEKGIFAKSLGEKTCMFKLGCRGPVTYTNCPIVKWNGGVNWPIGSNTPCIGCANNRFPDGMEPFVRT